MTKEFFGYKFLTFIYMVLIANTGMLMADGKDYYIWAITSIALLVFLMFIERSKLLGFFKNFKTLAITRYWVFLLVFVISFPRHYQQSRGLNITAVGILQVMILLLFFFVFCTRSIFIPDDSSHQ